MKDLKEYLRNTPEKEDKVCFDVVDPPCKRIRLEHAAEGPGDVNHNGELQQTPSTLGGDAAVESSAVKVCNVCLGILQEFCEADFVQKVNSSSWSFRVLLLELLHVGAYSMALLIKNTMQLNN